MIVAKTPPGSALLIIAVASAEVGYRKMTGRATLPWMRWSAGPSAAGIGFDLCGNSFQFGTGFGSSGFAGTDFAIVFEISCSGEGPALAGMVTAIYVPRSTAYQVPEVTPLV